MKLVLHTLVILVYYMHVTHSIEIYISTVKYDVDNDMGRIF